MTSNSSASNIVSVRYASALMDLAGDSKKLKDVEKDILSLKAMLESSEDFASFVEKPVVSRSVKLSTILEIAKKAKLSQITSNFLGVLAQNGRLPYLPSIVEAFENALAAQRGDMVAKVETAFALTDKQTKELQAQISKALGANVAVDVSVDKDLLGGMIVTVGSTMIDDSVRRKLERLERAMSHGAQEVKKSA